MDQCQSGASLGAPCTEGISGVKDTAGISVPDNSVPNDNSCLISGYAQTDKQIIESIGDGGSGKRDRSPTLLNNFESKKPRVEERNTTKLIEDVKNVLYKSVDTLSDPDKFSLYNSQCLEEVFSMSKSLLEKIENV